MPEEPKRLTLGMRCRIRVPKQSVSVSRNYSKEHKYEGREAFILKRERDQFQLLLIGKKYTGKQVLPKEKANVVEGTVGWFKANALEFVDYNFQDNIDYIDWYQENEHLFCGDCGEWYPEVVLPEYHRCPNPECPGARFNNNECIDCGTKLTGKYGDYCKRCKEHV